jgi:Zn-dependent membrane protease YugP
MILRKRFRRYISVILIILGSVLIFLAPDDAWIGIVFAAAGFILELIGLMLSHKKSKQAP